MVRHGFTLIELLVVISVIALLIAITIPTLSKSRQITTDLVCINSVRSVGIALIAYTKDHQEFFPYPTPYPQSIPSRTAINLDVQEHLCSYLDSEEMSTSRKTKPWVCGFDKDFYTFFGSSYTYYAGHYRYLFETEQPSGYPTMRIMTAYDCYPTMQTWGDTPPASYDHPNGRNYSRIDGSVNKK